MYERKTLRMKKICGSLNGSNSLSCLEYVAKCEVSYIPQDHSLRSKKSAGVASIQSLYTDRHHRPTKISNKYIFTLLEQLDWYFLHSQTHNSQANRVISKLLTHLCENKYSICP